MISFNCLNEICKLVATEYVISYTLENYSIDPARWKEFVSKLKYIFVGDNPGLIEAKCREYFYYDGSVNSQTGANTHNFIKDFLPVYRELYGR